MRTTTKLTLQTWLLTMAIVSMVAGCSISCATHAPSPSTISIPTWSERLPHQTVSNGISVAWHALVLSEQDTYVVYSLAADDLKNGEFVLEPSQASLRFGADAASAMTDSIPIGVWNGVSLGMLRFPGRTANASILQLEVDKLRVGDEELSGNWTLPMLTNSRPGNDSLTRTGAWPANGTVTQGSIDIVATAGRLAPDSAAAIDAMSGAAPPATPVPVDVAPDLLTVFSLMGVDSNTQQSFAATVEIDTAGSASVKTWSPSQPVTLDPEQAPLAAPDEGTPPEHVTLTDAVARSSSPVLIRSRLPAGVTLDQVTINTFSQPDDMIALDYSDGIQVVQFVMPPGTNMADFLAVSDSIVTVQRFDLNGVTASGFGSGSSKSPLTGEDIPFQGGVWWESDGVYHSIAGDATFEALVDIARGLRPAGQ